MFQNSKSQFFLILLILSRSLNCQYVSTVEPESNYYNFNTPQKQIQFSFNSDKKSLQEYTIWGWVKFNGDKEGIANFLILRGSSQQIPSNEQQQIPGINPNYPPCPFSTADLNFRPDLRQQNGVVNNPNCFIDQNLVNNPSIAGIDRLYINLELNPGFEDYSLSFLYQIGQTETAGMKIEGFSKLRYTKNSWIFVAFSADYRVGTGILYMKDYNKSDSFNRNKEVSLNYPAFDLPISNTLILANKTPVPYYQTDSPFVGNIGYIEVLPFFVQKLEDIWMGFMQQDTFQYNGILLQLLFEIYNQTSELQSYGQLKSNFEISGKFTPLYVIDKTLIGIRVHSQASINLGRINFATGQGIKALMFYFELSYLENLPDKFILAERGQEGVDGYIQISFVKEDRGRVVQLQAIGVGNAVNWISRSFFQENKSVFFQIGIILSPANSARVGYYDSNGTISTDLLANDFQFDVLSQQIFLLRQNQNDQSKIFDGHLDLLRFDLTNTASSIIYKNIFKDIADQELIVLNGNCELRSDYYEKSYACLKCKNSVLKIEIRECVNYCDFGEKNALNGVCVKCVDENCAEIPSTTWTVAKISSSIYRLTPSRKILETEKLDKDKLFEVELSGQNKELGSFDYETKMNPQTQAIDFIFNFKEKVTQDTLEFKLIEDPNSPTFDENYNRIYTKTVSIELEEICFLSTNKENALKALAIVILVMFLITFLVLVVVSFMYYNQIQILGTLWKFFLHNWMNLQLLTFFILIGIRIPCCVREFLHVLFMILVKWDYGLRWAIDGIFEGDDLFDRMMSEQQPPKMFNYENVRAFLLHNMGVLLLLHGIFFGIHTICKIILFFKKKSIFIKKILHVYEFTGIIVALFIFHMHIFVFCSLCLKQMTLKSWEEFYFVSCFLMSIVYLVGFALFWSFWAYRLLGSGLFFMDSDHFQKFKYFFIGYRRSKWINSYDLWRILIHFIIGIIIGTAWDQYLFQTIAIFLLILALIVISIVLRPWLYTIQFVGEIIQLFCILFVTIFFMVIAAYDNKGCATCGDREGTLCWFIVLLIFLGSIIGCFFLLAMIYMSISRPYLLQKVDISPDPFQEEEKQTLKTKNDILDDVTSSSQFKRSKEIDFSYRQDKDSQQHNENGTMNDFINNFSKQNQPEIYKNKVEPYEPQQQFVHNENHMAPDSVDEERIQSFVRETLISHNVEEEELPEFDYNQEKMRHNQNNNFNLADLQRVSPPNYFNYNNPQPPTNPNPQFNNRSTFEFKEDDTSVNFNAIRGEKVSISDFSNSQSKQQRQFRNDFQRN